MSWFLRPLVYGAEKIFKDFLKKLLGDFVELHNFKLEPLQGGFTGTLDGLHLKVAEINTLLGDIPLTLESGIIAKASVEISVKRECRLHLDGVELHFLVGADAMVRIKQEAKAEDLTRSTTEGKYQRQSDSENDDDDDDDSEAESEGEGEGEDGEKRGGAHKEMVTFTVLKEKIKEILRRVERVDVSNVHVLLSTKEGKGKQELHLHFNHLRYEDATQPESAPVPSPKSPARGIPGAPHGAGSASEEEIKIESSKVVKWLEVEGLKVMVEEFYKHKEGDEEILEIRPTKLLEISTVPQRNYSRVDDAKDRSDDEDEDDEESDRGLKGQKRETGGIRPTKNLSGRMQINLTVGQTVVVEEVDMAFDHHRIDIIIPPKYLRFVLDLADRFNAHKSDDDVSATATTPPLTTDNGDVERPSPTANAGLSVPVYAFPKCTLHVNRGSVILLEEDIPSPADEGQAVGASIKMGTSQSNEREMFTANSSSAMIADSVSQLDFVPFDHVPRFSWSFERASIALSSRMLPPPPPIPETLPSPLASGYYSPHSSLTPPPAAPFVRPPTRVPPPSSALLVDIRMRDCDLVEFVYERRAHGDDEVESEDEDDDRRTGSREIRFDLIRLGVKEEEDEEGEEDGDISINHGNDDGEMDSHGGGEGTATLVRDERFLIRFEKKVRIEEREIEASPPQTSFDNIDAEELAGIGVPPPPSSRTNSGFDQLLGEPPRSDSSNAVDSTELMVWEETKLTIETARLNIETDTKITERLERLMSRLSASPVAPAPETSPPPTWEEFLKEQARKEAEQQTREEEAIAASGNRPFENWSIQRNFFIDVGARKKLRANIHFYDAHGRRRKEKLDVLLFDTDKIKFSTCISSFDSSDQGLCAAFQDATILEFDFENIMATITSRLGFPKAPFFRASMADTHGDRVTPLEITLKPPTSLQTNDENIVGEMTALVGKKGHTFSSSEVERMNHFKYLTSQLAGVAIKIRFPFSEIELEKYDYDAIMAILDNLSSPAPPPASPPPPVTVPSTASSPAHARLSPSTSPSNRGVPVSFLETKAPRFRLDASTIVEVTLTHANLKLLESRGKASDETAKTKQSTHKPFHLHFVDVERLNVYFAGARFNDKPSNWLSVDADNFLLYERLMSASRSSVYTPATLVVNRNPFVTSAAAARPVFSSLFLLTGADDGVKNRMDFNDLIIHHKAGFQWYNHLGTFFSGEEQAGEQKAEDRKAEAPDAAEGPRTEGSEASVTQLFINLPNLELEYTPTLVPGNAFITTGYLQVDLMLHSGRKEPKRVADIPRLELNIVAKPRKINAGRNIAIYIAKSSAEEDDGDAADVDDNEMARQKRLHWRSNGKRYLKAGVLNSAFSVRLKSRLVDDEDHFLRLLRACGQPTPENENEHESDGVSGIDLRRFCDDASIQHSVGGGGGDGTPGPRSRKRTMGRWMTKLTLCQYDVNDDKSKTEENVRPFLLGFCADSLSTFVDIFNEALLPADLVLADIDPDAQAKRDEMAQQQRLRKEREEKRRAAMKRKQDELQRKAKSERSNQSSREGTAELTGGSSSTINSREGSGADGLDVSRIRESLPPEIAEKIRKQDEIRIEEARRRDRGRRSRSSSLTGNGDAEKKDKIHVSEARLQNGIWYTDPRKMKIITDYWHTPGDSRLLPDPASISSFCVAVKSGLSINLRLYSGLDWPALALAAPKGMELTMCTMMGNAPWCSNFSWAMS